MIIFQIKLLNETNFFLILIYLLLQLKIVHVFPLKFLWITSIQIALLLVNWPPQCIAIDHTSIMLKRVTIQLVVSEARLSVLTRFSCHNTSQVCTATLKLPKVRCFCVALFLSAQWFCDKIGLCVWTISAILLGIKYTILFILCFAWCYVNSLVEEIIHTECDICLWYITFRLKI